MLCCLSLFISKPISLSRKLSLSLSLSLSLYRIKNDSTPFDTHTKTFLSIHFSFLVVGLDRLTIPCLNVIFIPFLLKDASGWYRLLNGNVGRQRHFAVKKQIDLNNSTIGKSPKLHVH